MPFSWALALAAASRPVEEKMEEEKLLEKKLVGTEGTPGWAGAEGAYWPARYCDRLPAGVYLPAQSQQGPLFMRIKVETDDLLVMPDEAATGLLAEFRKFWGLKAEFNKRGFVHKRGFLLHGPPGSGKTSLIRLMVQSLVNEHDGVVCFVGHPSLATACFQMLRRTEPNRPLVALFEDFDAMIQRFAEPEFLAMLDGETQVDNVIYVATTNYPENLDARFLKRPGRFDTVQKIDMPSRAAREFYFRKKEPSLEDAELKQWLDLSNEFSIAHLREMILACRCLGHPIETVCERLRHGLDSPPKSTDTGRKLMGFGGNGKIAEGTAPCGFAAV